MKDHDWMSVWQADVEVAPANLSTDTVVAANKRFARRIAARNLREWVAASIVGPFFVWRAVVEPAALVRLGAALLVAATLFASLVLARRGRPAEPPPPDAPTRAHIAYHRAELLRQRALLRTAWWWYVTPFVPGFVLLFVGFAVKLPHQRVFVMMMGLGVCLPVLVALAALNRFAAKRLADAVASIDDIREDAGTATVNENGS